MVIDRRLLPALLAFAACGPPDEPDPPLALVAEGLDEALVCVQGTSASDVWAVGSDVGSGPLVVHFDGEAWRRIDTGATGDLWWVQPLDQTVVMVGEQLVLELDRASGVVTPIESPPGVTWFGVWGDEGSMLAVGGDVNGELGPAILHRTPSGWAPLAELASLGLAASDLLYKVHGAAADDAWIVGTSGIVLRWDGVSLERVDAGTSSPLFTVHAGGPTVVAVGGYGQAVALHLEGADWVDRSPAFEPQLNGVAGRGDTLVAVGAQGTVHRWNGATWIGDEQRVTSYDLHGVWIDEQNAVWTVGGALISHPLTAGLLAYQGERDIPPLEL